MSFYNLMPWSKKSVPLKRQELSSDYRPETSLRTLHHDINRLFDEFFGREDGVFFPGFAEPGNVASFSSMLGTSYPKIDFHETEKEFRLTAELPGMTEEDIELNLSQEVLTLRGEKKEEKVEDDKGWYRMERQYGSFSRSIPLPAEVDSAAIEATMKNGVLKIVMPKKAEETKPSRSISIKKQ
ncbi:MAG: Hsp20/alpha crystallin family protein [Candidatus Obscuribacterales bacterium]|nr:Hsp20/alpha crystallin family protein [Candidatus Obscuribacterales bacterium]